MTDTETANIISAFQAFRRKIESAPPVEQEAYFWATEEWREVCRLLNKIEKEQSSILT